MPRVTKTADEKTAEKISNKKQVTSDKEPKATKAKSVVVSKNQKSKISEQKTGKLENVTKLQSDTQQKVTHSNSDTVTQVSVDSTLRQAQDSTSSLPSVSDLVGSKEQVASQTQVVEAAKVSQVAPKTQVANVAQAAQVTPSAGALGTTVAPIRQAIRPMMAPQSRPMVRPMVRPMTRPMARPSIPPVQVQTQPGQTELIGGRVVWRSSMPPMTSTSTNGYQNGNFAGEVDGRLIPDAGVPTEDIKGILEVSRDGNGILRSAYSEGKKEAYISGTQIRRFNLRPGDMVEGPARAPKENEQFWGLLKVEKVNGKDPDGMVKRVIFKELTPVFPNEKLSLETGAEPLSTRLIDLVAPIGRGQRGLIVSPPKAGKTTILKDMATGIAANYKDVHLMAVLIGERPEEVTDIRRHIADITGGTGEVAASNFDEAAEEQARIAELALERAKRLVELGENVVILLDSITRLARAYNLAIPTSGRTLSGGFDPAALYPPKRFFGAARNFEPFDTPDGKKHGSLTILGTALTETGSKMDDLIYEEFKGTGNMELHLDRKLAERRIYPSIDVQRSGTRREDLLFSDSDYQAVLLMRRMYDLLDPKERTQALLGRMKQTKTNKEFLASLKEG